MNKYWLHSNFVRNLMLTYMACFNVSVNVTACAISQAIYRMVSNDKESPMETPEQRTERIFVQMDKNKDGVLTKKEFIDGCLADDVLCSMLTANTSSGSGQ